MPRPRPVFWYLPVICPILLLALAMPDETGEAQPLEGPIFSASADSDAENYMPAAAMASDGSFAVVWESDSDLWHKRVVARHYGSTGSPSGPSFVVHTLRSGNDIERARESDIAMNGKGSFAVSWETEDPTAIYARRFTSNGDPMDAKEIHVIDTTVGLRHSSVGIADDDSFAVVYEEATGMVVQLFNSDGSRVDRVPIPEAKGGLGEHLTPFAVGPDGSFVIAYTKGRHEGAVYARYWRSLTRTLSEELAIASQEYPVEAAMAADGSFTIVYFRGPSAEFKVARYDGAGNEVYNKTVYTAADGYRPRGVNVGAFVARDGSFSIVWCTSRGRPGGWPPFEAHTYAMAFGSDGTPRTSELLVSDPQAADSAKYYPAVGTNGKQVVAIWEQAFRPDGDRILGRRLTLLRTSPADLIEVVKQMLDDGLILNEGIANAITSSLENAQAMLDAGNVDAAANKIASLIAQIATQAGKQIDADAAATLIEHLESLLAALEEQ